MATDGRLMSRLRFAPVTPEAWPDLERLFGPRGACGGCWCMAWRLSRSDWERGKGLSNKRALKRLVQKGPPPGLLAYDGGAPIGWCAIEPRDAYPALDRSRVLKRIDDRPVWSVTCFFIAKPYRRRGVSLALLRAAVDHARDCGALVIEGYPFEPGSHLPDPFVWTGLADTFRAAGFVEAARRSRTRPIMRRSVRPRG